MAWTDQWAAPRNLVDRADLDAQARCATAQGARSTYAGLVARYYYAEHEEAYRRIELEGKTTWDELHGGGGFDDFSSRGFLDWALGILPLRPEETEVLEYGTGTGPPACFLAARGFRVEAIDLIPRAIDLAQRFAAERGVEVDFQVGDICALAGVPPSKTYDLILDTFCLQSIVLDEDRHSLFAAVRARLNPTGSYLISTAMYQPGRDYGPAGLYDERTGIVYARLADQSSRELQGAAQVGDAWYLPHRRHLKPEALTAELGAAGCRRAGQPAPVHPHLFRARRGPTDDAAHRRVLREDGCLEQRRCRPCGCYGTFTARCW